MWKGLRQRLITRPLFASLKRRLPPMSLTEREAIQAGDIWIEAELFQGRLEWESLFKLPKPTLNAEEQAFLSGPVEQLCSLFQEWELRQGEFGREGNFDLPKAAWDLLKQARFFGMIIPKTYGGLGFSALAHSAVVQKIASHSLTAAITAMVPNSLGPAELLIKYGTEEQKNYYLPRLASGEEIPCFGLTSEEAGSDAGAMTDSGIVCNGSFEGRDTIGIRLNWDKRYITLAPVASLIGLAFKLSDPDQLLGTKTHLGITLALIPRQHPGVEIGARHLPLNHPFMNGPIRGKDVFIPMDWVIGGVDRIGQGWRMLMDCLSAGRGISLPALSGASAKAAYLSTGAYARIRRQFKVPIGSFEGVKGSMAEIAGFTYMMEALRLLTLTALDQNIHPAVVSAIAKYHATELSRLVVNHAMDIHGGRGIMMGPNNYLAYHYEALPIGITVEGANLLTRHLMIFGQGAIRCHPYIQQEIEALNDPDCDVGLVRFEQVLFKHIRYNLCALFKTVFHGLTSGWFSKRPTFNEWSYYYRQLNRLSVALAWVSDTALICLGGRFKRLEHLSGRLGDVLSYLYMSCALMKYYRDFGHETEDKPLLEWGLKMCLYRIQMAFLAFFNNFPLRSLGVFFKFLVFPYGMTYQLPSDKLSNKIATEMMTASSLRHRFKKDCFLGLKSPLKTLEETLYQLIETEQKATTAEGSLEIQKNNEALRSAIIRVDEFQITPKASSSQTPS